MCVSDQLLPGPYEGDFVSADGRCDVHRWPASCPYVPTATHWEVRLQSGTVQSPRLRPGNVWANGCIQVGQWCYGRLCCHYCFHFLISCMDLYRAQLTPSTSFLNCNFVQSDMSGCCCFTHLHGLYWVWKGLENDGIQVNISRPEVLKYGHDPGKIVLEKYNSLNFTKVDCTESVYWANVLTLAWVH